METELGAVDQDLREVFQADGYASLSALLQRALNRLME